MSDTLNTNLADGDAVDQNEEEEEAEEQVVRLYQRVEFWSTVMLALATIATAWAGFQSSLWGGQDAAQQTRAMTAIIQSGKSANLAEQRLSLHVGLFTQWVSSVSSGDQQLADLLFARFPEPLKVAATAWIETDPLTNPAAPASPFEMPQYVLRDRVEAERLVQVAAEADALAEQAAQLSDRYLLFTIIFALVLFFCGISGKFHMQALDIAVLIIGSLVLLSGTIAMLQLRFTWL
jgi:hypothetical protein